MASLVFDDAGSSSINDLLGSVPETDFERKNLDRLLNDHSEPENWRVGEALAEIFLSENRGCLFPWPDGRDERKRGSSLPGADLVGFQNLEGEVRFAFGEVKTSAENKHPPGATYGRHGLKKQMEDLRDSETIRCDLVRYLAHRATGANWLELFKKASTSYLGDPCDVRIFGLLIRDVAPNEDDLRVRVETLGTDCPNSTIVELTALYLPENRIASLATTLMNSRQEGESS